MLLRRVPNRDTWIDQCGTLVLDGGRGIVSGGTIGGGIQVGKEI